MQPSPDTGAVASRKLAPLLVRVTGSGSLGSSPTSRRSLNGRHGGQLNLGPSTRGPQPDPPEKASLTSSAAPRARGTDDPAERPTLVDVAGRWRDAPARRAHRGHRQVASVGRQQSAGVLLAGRPRFVLCRIRRQGSLAGSGSLHRGAKGVPHHIRRDRPRNRLLEPPLGVFNG